jgi:hypothetical protein
MLALIRRSRVARPWDDRNRKKAAPGGPLSVSDARGCLGVSGARCAQEAMRSPFVRGERIEPGERAVGLRYELVNSAPVQRSGTFVALCEPSVEVPKVRTAGAMTWPPEGVTRKTASPR